MAPGLNPATPLGHLLHGPMRGGVVTWIGLRPVRRQPLVAVPHADLDPEEGLIGDHYHSRTNQARQVTVIQAEHTPPLPRILGPNPSTWAGCGGTSWWPASICMR
jgi:MOSC domain-containing protein YiiM